MNTVNAQLARQVLDLLVGFTIESILGNILVEILKEV